MNDADKKLALWIMGRLTKGLLCDLATGNDIRLLALLATLENN